MSDIEKSGYNRWGVLDIKADRHEITVEKFYGKSWPTELVLEWEPHMVDGKGDEPSIEEYVRAGLKHIDSYCQNFVMSTCSGELVKALRLRQKRKMLADLKEDIKRKFGVEHNGEKRMSKEIVFKIIRTTVEEVVVDTDNYDTIKTTKDLINFINDAVERRGAIDDIINDNEETHDVISEDIEVDYEIEELE